MNGMTGHTLWLVNRCPQQFAARVKAHCVRQVAVQLRLTVRPLTLAPFLTSLVVASMVLSLPALAETLTTTYYVPKSGHFVLERSWPRPVTGLTIRTADDVISLHRVISAQHPTVESAKGSAFLQAAGVSIGQPSLLPRPAKRANIKILATHPPEWTSYDVDLDGESIRQRFDTPVGDNVFVHTADADVVVNHAVASGQVTHGLPGSLHEMPLNTYALFSRSAFQFAQAGWLSERKLGERWHRLAIGGNEYVIVANGEKDDILARAIIEKGEVSLFTLHFQSQLQSEPRPYYLPRITCEFHKERSFWKLSHTLIKDVAVDIPIPQERFAVPLKPGQLYVAKKDDGTKQMGVQVKSEVADITQFTPAKGFERVIATRNANVNSLARPAYSVGAIVVIALLFAVFAWRFRSFYSFSR